MGFGLNILFGCKVEAGLEGERPEASMSVGRLEFRGVMVTLELW